MKKNILLISFIIIIITAVSGCKSNAAYPPAPQSPPLSQEDSQLTPTPKPEPTPVQTIEPEKKTTELNPAAKTSSWWFIRNKQHQPASINQDIASLLAKHNAFYLLPNNNQQIYLTFDCGYELGYTSKILDILDRQQVKAAFFVTGQIIKTHPELVKRMHSSGHLVCNHTLTHPDLPTLTQDKFNQDIISLGQKYTELTGAQISPYLRPPMGNYSPATLKWANELGYTTVFWSMAFQDWDPNNQPGADYSYKHVLENIHPGAVMLLHAVSQSNTEALDKIITDLRAQGYVFSTFNN
ncbi:MAG: delta-lactam-biosynthetic de-N-acetylase [Syntrophomonas sp.]|nr:delta-lactam-biosynthetic de-N-acetylase [Syntrophomonas sp.]